MRIICLIIFTLCLSTTCVLSRIVKTNISVTNGYRFLTKFAFDKNGGNMNLSILFDKVLNNNVSVVILTDDIKILNQVSSSNMTCIDMYTYVLAHNSTILGQPSQDSRDNYTTTLAWNNNQVVSPNNQYTFIMLFDCNATYNISIVAKLTNGPASNNFRYHFSVDEFYVLEMSIAMIILYTFLQCGAYIYRRFSKDKVSSSFRMFNSVITSKWIIFFVEVIVWSVYGNTGSLNIIPFMIMEIFNLYTVITFIEQLVILGYGYEIMFTVLPIGVIIILVVFCLFYFISGTIVISLFIINFDNSYLNYMYDTGLGQAIIAFQFFMALVFMAGCGLVKNLIFCVFSLLWILSVPILLLVASYHMSPYNRFGYVYIIRNSLDAAAHTAYLFVLFCGFTRR